MKRLFAILLVIVITATMMCGCESEPDTSEYHGTWVRSLDRDLVNCLIFDENGYWDIFIDYRGILYGMRERPELFSTFDHFIDGHTYGGITGCSFKYIANTDYSNYTDTYEIDENGKLDFIGSTGAFPYERYSYHTGYPEDAILTQCRDIFNRALNESKQ